MYCECLKRDSFTALFGIYSTIQRYHRISQAVVRLQVLNLTCQTKNASCSSTRKSPPGQCTCTCGRDSQREQIPPWVDEVFGTLLTKKVQTYSLKDYLKLETTNISELHNTSTEKIYELENFSNNLSTTTPFQGPSLPFDDPVVS